MADIIVESAEGQVAAQVIQISAVSLVDPAASNPFLGDLIFTADVAALRQDKGFSEAVLATDQLSSVGTYFRAVDIDVTASDEVSTAGTFYTTVNSPTVITDSWLWFSINGVTPVTLQHEVQASDSSTWSLSATYPETVTTAVAVVRSTRKVPSDTVTTSSALAYNFTMTPIAETLTASDTASVGYTPATFIGAEYTAPGAGTCVFALPGSAAAGDMAIVFVEFLATANTMSVNGSTWSYDFREWGYGYFAGLAWRKLEASDITNGSITATGSQFGTQATLVVYRNANTTTVKSHTEVFSGATASLPGFVKASGHRGVVALISDRDPDVNAGVPSGFTQNSYGTSEYYSVKTASNLVAGSYVDNATIDFTSMQGAANYPQHGYVLEFT